jgi:hypothetical protein
MSVTYLHAGNVPLSTSLESRHASMCTRAFAAKTDAPLLKHQASDSLTLRTIRAEGFCMTVEVAIANNWVELRSFTKFEDTEAENNYLPDAITRQSTDILDDDVSQINKQYSTTQG